MSHCVGRSTQEDHIILAIQTARGLNEPIPLNFGDCALIRTDMSHYRFYEKVANVKADVAAILKFLFPGPSPSGR
jgi:hypothetical protein